MPKTQQGILPANPKDLLGCQKTPLGLMPVSAMAQCSIALHDGRLKYNGAGNWRETGVRASIYYDAALRHIFAWIDGQECAADSGVHHLGHALACVSILVDAQENGNLIDDRPPPGPGVEVIDRLRESVDRINKKYEEKKQIVGRLEDLRRELLIGHEIIYNDDNKNHGTIDGEYFTGTSFTSRVERYRRGHETVDDEIESIGCAVREPF